jgi:hypothetical protein
MARKITKQPERDDLIEFVERVRRRNGYVNVQELLVEMITLHQKYIALYRHEKRPPNFQLMMMWKDLENLYERQIKSELQHGDKTYYAKWCRDQKKINEQNA